MKDINNALIPELGIMKTPKFSEMYPALNKWMLDNLDIQDSRVGKTKELLDFKSMLTNPYNRCVGGFGRDINIFFLLAEAMWIFNGKKDVHFLTLFNKKMSDFSDDGKTFHAPYGFRLRHWGVRAEDTFLEENMNVAQGHDQIADAVKILNENSDSRQVVLQIWNPDFDLGAKTKDTPCNDTLMVKVRKGKLISTIQNRSNDLHWGLPTNIFQFSFLTELFANCIGVELGTQTHNSQSLHIYEWNETASKMKDAFEIREAQQSMGHITSQPELYEVSHSKKIDFNFEHEVPGNRLREIDIHLNLIIDNLTKLAAGETASLIELQEVSKFSKYLYLAYNLCAIYLRYKKLLADKNNDAQLLRVGSLQLIDSCVNNIDPEMSNLDIVVLAKNFFASRLKDYTHEYLGKL